MQVTRSPITVDDRQQTPPSHEQVEALNRAGVGAEVRRLDLGDYQWVVARDDGVYGFIVEEKLINDLLNSVADGRLGAFVRGEVGGNVRRALLVVGTPDDISKHHAHWTPDSVDNLLASVQDSGVTVLRCESPARSAERIAAYWRYTGSPEHRTLDQPVLPQTESYYSNPQLREAVRMLMCLPGIGEQRARALIKEYGSVGETLLQLMVSKTTGADGVGPKSMAECKAFLNREY